MTFNNVNYAYAVNCFVEVIFCVLLFFSSQLEANSEVKESNEVDEGIVFARISGGVHTYEFTVLIGKHQVTKIMEDDILVQDATAEYDHAMALLSDVSYNDKDKDEVVGLEWVKEYFSYEEIISIAKTYSYSIGNNCKVSNRSVTIRPVTATNDYIRNFFRYARLIPNYNGWAVVYSPSAYTKGSGMLISLNQKIAVLPLCQNIVRKIKWSRDGRYIAYAVSENSLKPKAREIVIYDVEKKRQVSIVKTVGDVVSMDWSPDSLTIAALVFDSKFSLRPWNFFKALAGHPSDYSDALISIIDVNKGALLEEIDLDETVKNGSGEIKWIN